MLPVTVIAVVQNGVNFSIIISILGESKLIPVLDLFMFFIWYIFRLSRVYILINAKHGVNQADKLMLQDLDERIQSGHFRWTLQAIITKTDLVPLEKLDTAISSIKQTIFDNAPTCLPPIVTAAPVKSTGLGIDDVRRSIVEACGLARSIG
jgi:GTP-binding protein